MSDPTTTAVATSTVDGSAAATVDIVLSMRNPRYKEIMWTRFNLLGRQRDHSREDAIITEVFQLFKSQRAKFYKQTKQGDRVPVNEEEALAKITYDIKRRLKSVHNWLQVNETMREYHRGVSDAENSSDSTSESHDERQAPIGGCDEKPHHMIDVDNTFESGGAPLRRSESVQSSQIGSPKSAKPFEECPARSTRKTNSGRNHLDTSMDADRGHHLDDEIVEGFLGEDPRAKSDRATLKRSPPTAPRAGAGTKKLRRNSRIPQRDIPLRISRTTVELSNSVDDNPTENDIVLSLLDDRYREEMHKHYNLLGPKRPSDREREEAMSATIFRVFKRRLGRSGRFFKKEHRGIDFFLTDDEGAMHKIFRDVKRRMENPSWLAAPQLPQQPEAGPDSTRRKQRRRKNPPISNESGAPNPNESRGRWRDQLAPSPVDHKMDELSESMATPSSNYHALPPINSRSRRRGQNLRKEELTKLLVASHLGQRLAPLKEIPHIELIETPNQLVHYLLLATHKLNELNGTHIKHCRVLRLYNLAELNEDRSAILEAPSLARLAKNMSTTSEQLHSLFCVYLDALASGFDFYTHGDDLFQDHSGIFNMKRDPEVHQWTADGERALNTFCHSVLEEMIRQEHSDNGAHQQVANLFGEGTSTDRRRLPPRQVRDGKSSSLTRIPDWLKDDIDPPKSKRQKVTFDAILDAGQPNNRSETCHVSKSNENVFSTHLRQNQARLCALSERPDVDQLLVASISLDTIVKRLKCGSKTRTLCMISGCKKHAQTRCDGLCNAHYNTISTGKSKMPISSGANSATGENAPWSIRTAGSEERARLATLLGPEEKKEAALLGPEEKKESFNSAANLEPPRRLSDVDIRRLIPDARIYVKWSGDGRIYQATVKKLMLQRDEPVVKIHYDGKKKHIFNNIPVSMVHSFIGEDKVPVEGTEHQEESSPEQEGNLDFRQLNHLYPCVLKDDEDICETSCPRLGPAWLVRVVRRKNASGNKADRSFISPSGAIFRSIPELERHFENDPREFGGSLREPAAAPQVKSPGSRSTDDLTAKAPDMKEAAKLPVEARAQSIGHACHESNVAESTDECDEIAAINVDVNMPSPPAKDREENSLSRTRQSSSFSPLKVQNGGFIDRPITYSPITIHSGQLVQHALPETSQSGIVSDHTKSTTCQLPSKAVENSAFSRAPRTLVRPTLTHRLCGDPLSLFCSIRGVGSSKPLASLKRDMAVESGFNAKRPRRKVATAMQGTPATPALPCAEKPDTALSALCHCPACDKANLSIQGLYAHWGKVHEGKVSWKAVTFSCPFCPPKSTARSKLYKSFRDLDSHVRQAHPKCMVLGPKSPRGPRGLAGGHNSSGGIRVDRTAAKVSIGGHFHGSNSASSGYEPVPQTPHKWQDLEFTRLVSDIKTDDGDQLFQMIDGQCLKQEALVEEARHQRRKQCKAEAESEMKTFDEERLAYQRGIRDRRQLADQETLEKQRFVEFWLYRQHRGQKRSRDNIEIEQVCTRPIKFSRSNQSRNSQGKKLCREPDCMFCQKDRSYLRHVLLDDELECFEVGESTFRAPAIQKGATILSPYFHDVSDQFLDQAAAEETEATTRQSRRALSTARRVKAEEDKLWSLTKTKHSLAFIKKYNKGLIRNAWQGVNKL